MKNDKDIKIESCSSTGDLVAYLYDELNASERSLFETHLADCGICTDEFAELSFARLDVYEWRRDEFARMETPRIVIPYAQTEAGVSWLDAMRGFFASNRQWAMAGGAFALIAVVFGAVLISSSLKGGEGYLVQGPAADDVASNKIQPVVLPVMPPSVEDKNAGPSNGVSKSGPQVDKASSAEKSPKTAGTTIRRPVKNSERIQNKPVQAQRTTAPRLNDFEDEDDNTLRLGDLLADVDTRD